jgi:hypothetical protein
MTTLCIADAGEELKVRLQAAKRKREELGIVPIEKRTVKPGGHATMLIDPEVNVADLHKALSQNGLECIISNGSYLIRNIKND